MNVFYIVHETLEYNPDVKCSHHEHNRGEGHGCGSPIAVIKKNKKIQHERMRQGNARIIVIHPFVFGIIIFLSLLVESNGWNV